MYGAKAKGLFIKNISKISWHRFSKIWVVLITSMKNESQMKSFQSNINALVRGHICSFLQMRWVTGLRASCVWLDWIDHWSFILYYGQVHTWSTHTSLIFNECLLHLCDCTCLYVMCVCLTICRSNQKDFYSFYLLLEVICITHVFLSFSSWFCVKNMFSRCFHDLVRE